jgi:TolA-binding protein
MNKRWPKFNFNYFAILLTLFLTYCAYYNTFFNAEENYRMGMEKKNSSPTEDKIPKDIVRNFESAISKSWSVIEIYGDSNSWADDALLLIGKSHYQIEEYKKSQEILEQFLQKYLRSPLRSEATLWLAKTFKAQGEIDEALNSFTNLIANSSDDDILADAYFNIGEIYFNSGDYELAITNYQKCVDLSSSDEMAGTAQYKLADAYYNSKDYENAVTNYQDVLRYDMPIIKQYDAVIQMSNALMKLDRFEEAREMLLNIMRDQRFKAQYSMIATKLANMIEFQGDTDFAVEKYYEVMENYPKTEGAALASFYIAQIYEFEYGWLDSAKVKYENVKKIYSKSESVKDANERASILSTYLTIRNNLRKDKEDIFKLEHGDSLLIDSLEVKSDSTLANDEESESMNSFEANMLMNSDNDSLAQTSLQRMGQQKKPKVEKKAVTRTPEEVKKSLLKNSFNLAEFFLLTYQHYDSAKAAYINFLNNFSDSLLTPKAYYSLYYIYNNINNDSLAADSVKQIILTRYPDTVYGKKLSGIDVEEKETVNIEIKEMFLNAEDLVDNKEYSKAIDLYNQIAKQDSGSIWAQKSRYATAYIYENYLNDTDNAVKSYATLAKEYPASEEGHIATNKIAEPQPDSTEAETMQSDSLSAPADTTNRQQEPTELSQPDTTGN